MACTDCGDNTVQEGAQRSFDCNQGLSCNNPCGTGPGNTAKCESLPSQIENFSLQFFGEVIKTEVDGKVVWSLPCNLDVGLPNNPRGLGEGLACYFLRLFHDGITGLTGPQGDAGADGVAGRNGYAVVLKSFSQPDLSNPIVQITGNFNPAIAANMFIFLPGSGWYLVNGTDTTGVIFATFQKSVDDAGDTVPAGTLIIPSGYPGSSVQGPQGIQGPAGGIGPAGQVFTTNWTQYFATSGTDFTCGVAFAVVDFITSKPQFAASSVGKYVVTVVATVRAESGALITDTVTLKLRNENTNVDVPGANNQIVGLAVGATAQVTITSIASINAIGQVVGLFAETSVAGRYSVLADYTTLTAIQIA